MRSDITERLIALGPLINEICTIAGVPGLSLGVSYKGETIHRLNYGYKDVEKQQPAEPDTAYGIGSITKCFTAMAICQLISKAAIPQLPIEKSSDISYENYLQKSIFGPLQLTKTTADHGCIPSDLIAKSYTVLDGGSFSLLPQPKAQDGTIMGPAQGILSTVNDMLKYSNSLLQALSDEKSSPLKNAKSQLSGHISTAKSILESYYGLGFFRHQLPGTITGTGINGAFVKKLPVITPRGGARFVISHPDSSLVVLTNSIGWADPSVWIGHIIVKALVDTPNQVDILQYVREAAENHKNSYPNLQKPFDEARSNETKSSPAEEDVGTYRNEKSGFLVEIRAKTDGTIQVAFQGLDSQVWDLTHYENDTFHWLSSRDEQAKRARFTYPFSPGFFKIIIKRNSEGHIYSLCWSQDASIPADEQCFSKVEMAEGKYGIQKIM
ncbi:hypothetical protein VE03_01517 [Pseudogymnoascus sp. 23342-1-I1]|nr:hypothetical protein VE03_01517 [Pseudogymnoascus sp. 23342-1-I1]